MYTLNGAVCLLSVEPASLFEKLCLSNTWKSCQAIFEELKLLQKNYKWYQTSSHSGAKKKEV